LDAGILVDMDGDPRPIGAGPDIGADEFLSSLSLLVQATPDPAQAGVPMTYTLKVINNGLLTLTTLITDQLPSQVSPGGMAAWQTVLGPGQSWDQTLVVTPDASYNGLLSNFLKVTSVEGAGGGYTLTSLVIDAILYTLPATPVIVEPVNGADDQPLIQTLRWQGSDADDDPLTYRVHLGATNPPPAVAETMETSYEAILEPGRTYYWSITAFDRTNSQAGPIWYFTTRSVSDTVLNRNLYLPLVSQTP
jgi:uncharacterized repeat protein (TIGR01451 family)